MILSISQSNQSRPSFKAKFSDDEGTKQFLESAMKDSSSAPLKLYSTIQLLKELGTEDTFSVSSKKDGDYTEYIITNNTDNTSEEIIKLNGRETARKALSRLCDMLQESMYWDSHKDLFKYGGYSISCEQVDSLLKKFEKSFYEKAGTEIHNDKINKTRKEREALEREMHRLEYEKTKREKEFALSCLA